MAKRKKQGGASLKERLCHTLDIQPDVFPTETHVDIRGRNSVSVKGAGCITVYTDKEVRLSTRGGSISIRGKRLCCLAYCRGSVVVDGCIDSIGFEEEKGE